MAVVLEPKRFSSLVEEKIQNSIQRLNQVLPLKFNQQKLSPELLKLHREILYAYIDLGRSLTKAELAEQVSDVETAINTLKEKDLVVFDANSEPFGAYPFTMQKREHRVVVNGHHIYSMCAMDALSISPMFTTALQIHSKCRLSGSLINIVQNGYAIENTDEVANTYFAINWNAASASGCCADSLCTEMIFIQGKKIAEQWYKEEPQQRDIYTLDEAISFGAGFFVPLLKN